jgi:hypothetical protein
MGPEPNFLSLDPNERADILQTLAVELGRPAAVLEKDKWVCWVLSKLFSLPISHRLAFKGGTSLSKVYGLIHRFSEDIDVTVDYRDFGVLGANLHHSRSRSQIAKRNQQLHDHLSKFVTEQIIPAFQEHIKHELPHHTATIETAGTDRVHLRYESVVSAKGSFIPDQVLLELGSRNPAEPIETHRVTSDIAHRLNGLSLPEADVHVLSPARTFWEKATLIHAACHKETILQRRERLSRHWYDLVQIADSRYGASSINNLALFREVAQHKDAFYPEREFAYSSCVVGDIVLVPKDNALRLLSRDYEAMVNAGMFTVAPPTFEEIAGRLRRLQDEINALK